MSVRLIEEPAVPAGRRRGGDPPGGGVHRADPAAPRAAGARPGGEGGRGLRPVAGVRARPRPPAAGSRCRPRDVLELLRAYPKWRFQSLVLQQASSAFLSLRGHLSDELREINFCRVRLAELQRLLETPPRHVRVRAARGRLLLPAGCKDLGEAVDGFLAGRRAGGAAGTGRARAGGDPESVHRPGPHLPGQRQPAEERRGGDDGDRAGVRRRSGGRDERGGAVPGTASRRGRSRGRGVRLLRRGAAGIGRRARRRRRRRSACWPRRRERPATASAPWRAAPCRTWRCCPPSARTTSCFTARSPTCRWPNWSNSARPARTPTAR